MSSMVALLKGHDVLTTRGSIVRSETKKIDGKAWDVYEEVKTLVLDGWKVYGQMGDVKNWNDPIEVLLVRRLPDTGKCLLDDNELNGRQS